MKDCLCVFSFWNFFWNLELWNLCWLSWQGDMKKEVEVLAQMLKEAQVVLVDLEKAKVRWW